MKNKQYIKKIMKVVQMKNEEWMWERCERRYKVDEAGKEENRMWRMTK